MEETFKHPKSAKPHLFLLNSSKISPLSGISMLTLLPVHMHHYDMILGHDIMSELGITLDFKDQTMTWDDLTIHMKDPESLLDLLDPVNDFFWNNDQYETEVLQEASIHLQKILDAKYEPADLDVVVQACRHLTEDEKHQLHAILCKYEHLFDGTLGTWNNEPYNIELKEGAKPYHSRPFPVPKVHEHTLKVELEDSSNWEC